MLPGSTASDHRRTLADINMPKFKRLNTPDFGCMRFRVQTPAEQGRMADPQHTTIERASTTAENV
jgi:hypothetical protein